MEQAEKLAHCAMEPVKMSAGRVTEQAMVLRQRNVQLAVAAVLEAAL